MSTNQSQEAPERRSMTFGTMVVAAIASISINVAGAYLLVPAPWNIPFAVAMLAIEVGAFLVLPHIIRDFKEGGVLAASKAVVSGIVFLGMCAMCIFSGHRAMSEVAGQMKTPVEGLVASAEAYTTESKALAEQAREWKASAKEMRNQGYVSKAAELEDRALNATLAAASKKREATEASSKASTHATLGNGQIWFILVMLEIVKAAGRFLFAIPMSTLSRRKEQVVVEAPKEIPQSEIVLPNYREPVVSAKSQVKGYKPKKVALRTPVNPASILNALVQAGVEGAVIKQAQALYEASGGDRIFGVYDPNAGSWKN